MKKILFYIPVLFALILSEGCYKDKDEFIVTSVEKIPVSSVKSDTIWEDESKLIIPSGVIVPLLNIEKLIKELNLPILKDTFIAEQGGKLELPDDITIEIPSSSCINKNNNQPCRGKLDVEYLVLRTKGELIAHDKPTISLGRLLTSGGVVYLMVKQNGSEVKLASNKTVKVRFKTKTTESGMLLFEGKSLNRLQFDWFPIGITANRDMVTTWADSSREKKGYQLLLDRFGWINCDKFNEETNLTNKFCVAIPDTFTNRNTSVYLAFKDINSVVKLEGTPLLKQFCIPVSYKGIPVGKQVTVISISNIEGRYFMATQEVKVESVNNIRLIPQRLASEEIKKKILNL
jgi:hypothetical protein